MELVLLYGQGSIELSLGLWPEAECLYYMRALWNLGQDAACLL